jgi:hypothetical protein
MTKALEVFVKNPYQNMGQAHSTVFFNNLSFNPTVEELNRTAAFPGQSSQSASLPQRKDEEPLFGEHIREAATTVKKLFGRR